MTTKLKVLLDEALSDVLAAVLEQYSSALNVEYVRNMPGFGGTEDLGLIRYAKATNRILVTVDTGFNQNTYPPCTHPGIIRITTRNKHEAIQGGVFRRFLLSGYRKHTRSSVTFVSDGKARIVSHYGETIYTF